jgi:2-phosphoglycerate kinase
MFTKQDYIEYFRQIASIEKEMMLKCEHDLGLIEDPDVGGQIRDVMNDEARHYSYVNEILDVLE